MKQPNAPVNANPRNPRPRWISDQHSSGRKRDKDHQYAKSSVTSGTSWIPSEAVAEAADRVDDRVQVRQPLPERRQQRKRGKIPRRGRSAAASARRWESG